MKKLIIGLIVIAFSVGCTAASGNAPSASLTAPTQPASTASASAEGYITPVRHAELAFRAGGRVTEILVTEGDQVKAGQPLIKLQETALRAALEQAQADLSRLQKGARPEEIAAAQAGLDIAKGQLEVSQANLARLQSGQLDAQRAAAQADRAHAQAELKVAQDSYDALVLGDGHGVPDDLNLPGRGLGSYEEQKRAQLAALQAAYSAAQKRVAAVQTGTATNLQSAQASVEVAQAQGSVAEAQLALIKAGATTQQIEIAQARVAQAQAALNEATLLAPFDGTIADLTIHVGEIAAPGIRVASIADLTQWEVDTDDLSEVDVVGVPPDKAVFITVDALTGVTLKGYVKTITPRSVMNQNDVTYALKIIITDSEPRLKWGMTASVIFK